MTARQKSLAMWRKVNPGKSFRKMVALYDRGPRVKYETRETFLLARPVPHGALLPDVFAEKDWPADECDTWFFLCYIGDMVDLLELVPYMLPFVAWWRGKTSRLHFARWEHIRKLMSFGVDAGNGGVIGGMNALPGKIAQSIYGVKPGAAQPVTINDPTVLAAENEYARINAGKKSVKKTILAGDMGTTGMNARLG